MRRRRVPLGLLAYLACLPLIYLLGRLVYSSVGARTIVAVVAALVGAAVVIAVSPDKRR
jgi:hypothetical protein